MMIRDGRIENRLFTDEQIRRLRERVAAGEPQYMVARDYGVSGALVSNIVHRKIYADVEDRKPGEPGWSFAEEGVN